MGSAPRSPRRRSRPTSRARSRLVGGPPGRAERSIRLCDQRWRRGIGPPHRVASPSSGRRGRTRRATVAGRGTSPRPRRRRHDGRRQPPPVAGGGPLRRARWQRRGRRGARRDHLAGRRPACRAEWRWRSRRRARGADLAGRRPARRAEWRWRSRRHHDGAHLAGCRPARRRRRPRRLPLRGAASSDSGAGRDLFDRPHTGSAAASRRAGDGPEGNHEGRNGVAAQRWLAADLLETRDQSGRHDGDGHSRRRRAADSLDVHARAPEPQEGRRSSRPPHSTAGASNRQDRCRWTAVAGRRAAHPPLWRRRPGGRGACAEVHRPERSARRSRSCRSSVACRRPAEVAAVRARPTLVRPTGGPPRSCWGVAPVPPRPRPRPANTWHATDAPDRRTGASSRHDSPQRKWLAADLLEPPPASSAGRRRRGETTHEERRPPTTGRGAGASRQPRNPGSTSAQGTSTTRNPGTWAETGTPPRRRACRRPNGRGRRKNQIPARSRPCEPTATRGPRGQRPTSSKRAGTRAAGGGHVKSHGTAAQPDTTTKPQDGTIARERRAPALSRRSRPRPGLYAARGRPSRTRCGSSTSAAGPGGTSSPRSSASVGAGPAASRASRYPVTTSAPGRGARRDQLDADPGQWPQRRPNG